MPENEPLAIVFDESRNFIIVEDNGDGTVTQIVNMPKMGFTEQIVSVMEIDLVQMINTVVSKTDIGSEMYKAVEAKTTIIPNYNEGE